MDSSTTTNRRTKGVGHSGRDNRCSSAYMVNTRQVLLDYMKYRMENAGINPQRHESKMIRQMFACVGLLTSSVNKTIIDLGTKIDSESSIRHFLERPVSSIDVSRSSGRAFYFAWLNELFQDKMITWARLALVIVFTARLAEKTLLEGDCDQVRNIANWCCQYFTYNMFDQWVLASGGWEKLTTLDDEKTLSLLKRMPDKKTVAYSAMAFLAALTTGILMTG